MVRTADRLIDLSLSSNDGAFLGGEDDLLRQLEVSRPTLRQAAKIAENDRLLSVRRGPRGGFYAARPDMGDAIRAMARHLRFMGTSLRDTLVVSRILSQEAAGAAALCTDPVQRETLARLSAGLADCDTARAMIRQEHQVAMQIAEMSGNPLVKLVIAIGYSFGVEEQGPKIHESAEQRAQNCALLQQICDAILDGDGEIARLLTRRRSEKIWQWLGMTAEAGPAIS
ncbi:FCD domain-containing protein [Sphingobium sp. Sx8-8]|uniref:FadR/GntR family transcriptional regulator n=1 Tax=Sphingobium sp. Sx8-8 TaxID=2933617 RepID=UPI001F58F2A5|nr:FCD domain-containing protein [Sphingobium sp. Sx8-8]